MTILGIGGVLNDAAAAVIRDGTLVAAVEQRKVSRRQRPGELPEEAIATCVKLAGVADDRVDVVAIARPFASAPGSDLNLRLRSRFPNARIVLVEHHTAHAASAYYCSGFEEATVLTLDRAGDFRCGGRWQASGRQLRLEKELYYPDSLGDLYGRVTELLGFESGADEHKVQWMAASGTPELAPLFRDMLPLREVDWPRSDRSFFDGERLSRGGFSERFFDRLGVKNGADLSQERRIAIAAGLQRALEETVLEMAGSGDNLCLAGGVAFNALLVAALERSERWRNVFVQPAAGNAGTALGAVLYAWHNTCGQTARVPLGNLCIGPSFSAEEIKKVIENCKLGFRYLLTFEELIDRAVEELQASKIVAWMHGRMEFGPRALGNRSILASPLNPYSSENLNVFIKHREPFRKFAASVPAEAAARYFEVGSNSRFLATVGRVRPEYRETFQSAILGGDLVRVHTVERDDNPLYWRLLHRAAKETGLPVLYNTSFNLFGDPLVCTPRDAVRSFYSSGIDSMFVGHFWLQK